MFKNNDDFSPAVYSNSMLANFFTVWASEVLSNVEHEIMLYSHQRPCDWKDISPMHKVTLHNWGNNQSFRKNEDSEGNSYTLIQEQVVGSDGGQHIKSR